MTPIFLTAFPLLVTSLFLQCEPIRADPTVVINGLTKSVGNVSVVNATLLRLLISISHVLSGSVTIFDFMDSYENDTANGRNAVAYKMQNVSISNELKILINSLPNIREDPGFSLKSSRLISMISDIETLFKEYVLYSRNFSKSTSTNSFHNATYLQFVDRVFMSQTYGIGGILERIKLLIAPRTPDVLNTQSEFSVFVKEIGWKNTEKQSHMQILTHTLGKIMLMETKALIVRLFAYDVQEWLKNGDYTNEKNLVRERTYERCSKYIELFKDSLNPLSNRLYTIDPPDHVEDVTYAELYNPFKEESDKQASCSEAVCSELFDGIDGCDSYETRHNNCQFQYYSPKLEDLDYPGSDNLNVRSFGNKHKVCYDYNKSYGDIKYYRFFKSTSPSCPVKYCACDANYKYSISLSYTRSNIHENYVVTGARFVIENRIIYIQLQEGKLEPYGNINASTIRWIPLNNDFNPVYPLHIYCNKVDLNHVTVPPQHVIVGLNIIMKKVDILTRMITLRIAHAPINFATGRLNYLRVNYIEAIPKFKRSLTISYLNNPTLSNENAIDSDDYDYVNIYTNERFHRTIPYIDLQNADSSLPTPLSGLGIIHKGTKSTAGFLALSLYTYDVNVHMQMNDTVVHSLKI